jgi:hypothetical protein
MNAPVRKFEVRPAKREHVPLFVGLMGPPGAGKTYSALTLAEGMRAVGGGDPVLIDTEGGRSKKYADMFRFNRIDFGAPFRPTDFLAAVRAADATGPCAIILDSASDEHEGEGGVLDWHDAELERMAGNDWGKRERVGQAAWIKPKGDRRTMISGLLQIKTPLIFCFRAREKVKQIRNERGKMEPTNIGYQPIAPSEIVSAMDVNCVLPPKSDGVPVWKSDKMGEDFIIKLPAFFKSMFTEGKPITRETGRALAEWARGGSSSSPQQSPSPQPAAADRPASSSSPPGDDGAGSGDDGMAFMSSDWSDYCEWWLIRREDITTADQLRKLWSSPHQKAWRRHIGPTKDELDEMLAKVKGWIDELEAEAEALAS